MFEIQRPQYSKIQNIHHYGFIIPNIYVSFNSLSDRRKCHLVFSRYQETPIIVDYNDIPNIPNEWIEVNDSMNKTWWVNLKEVSSFLIRDDDWVDVWVGYNCIIIAKDEYIKLLGQDSNVIKLA